jgi:SOS response regulatory protein OraA/RecX
MKSTEEGIKRFLEHHGEINRETIAEFLGCEEKQIWRIENQAILKRDFEEENLN